MARARSHASTEAALVAGRGLDETEVVPSCLEQARYERLDPAQKLYVRASGDLDGLR